jgi:hypothetical protein
VREANFQRQDRGQVLVMVALMLTALVGFTGLALDVAWYELNLTRVQRAADAGALAGVVYLPGNVPGAVTAAQKEVAKNGFANGVNGVIVTAAPESANNKILDVTVTAPVRTFFGSIFGVASFTARRKARAEFVLPVPMGSPQNYLGINVLCRDSDISPNCPTVPDATGVGQLQPLGFFAAIEYRGDYKEYGDAYSPYYDPTWGGPGLNQEFDPNGYSYAVDFPAGTVNGTVWLYSPIFCATGASTSTGRRLGVGDYWFTNGGTPMTTVYNFWDTNGTPYDYTDDILLATQTYVSNGVDKSAALSGNGNYGGGANAASLPDCSLDPAHNNWVQLKTGLGPGQYRLQVVTSSGTNLENGVHGFGIEATSTAGPTPRVYGQQRMATYIVVNNISVFYLAQIEAAHAGKTLEIHLFDPGDISQTTFRIRIPSAAAPGYTYATFTWKSDKSWCGQPTSGGPTTSLVASDASACAYFENAWLTISVPIPQTYTADVAPGDPPGAGGGWWKIEYDTLGTGDDIATWTIAIRGNPVHLITP